MAGLAAPPHEVDRWGDWNELASHVHGIAIDPACGTRHGGSGPRSDGATIGYANAGLPPYLPK